MDTAGNGAQAFENDGGGASVVEWLGPFVIGERLGTGGMAIVHRAIERRADGDRVVALKRLLPHLTVDASFVQAFLREGRLAKLLEHPNIVHLHEAGRIGSEFFLSMELLEGHDLRQLLKHSRQVGSAPPPMVVVEVIRQLCRALQFAHDLRDADGKPLGIIHRDISPSNVFVTHDGVVKVIDFGIAKASSGRLGTRTGSIKGKLPYIAPEAFRGIALDRRADVFSTAVLAHELMTARPLFAAKEDYATIERVQHMVVPSPSSSRPACPRELDAIILRGLERSRRKRWQSAAELGAALDELVAAHDLPCGPELVANWTRWSMALTSRPTTRPSGTDARSLSARRPARSTVTGGEPAETAGHSSADISVVVTPMSDDEIDRVASDVWDCGPSAVVSAEPTGRSAAAEAGTVPPPMRRPRRAATSTTARPPAAGRRRRATSGRGETLQAPVAPMPSGPGESSPASVTRRLRHEVGALGAVRAAAVAGGPLISFHARGANQAARPFSAARGSTRSAAEVARTARVTPLTDATTLAAVLARSPMVLIGSVMAILAVLVFLLATSRP